MPDFVKMRGQAHIFTFSRAAPLGFVQILSAEVLPGILKAPPHPEKRPIASDRKTREKRGSLLYFA